MIDIAQLDNAIAAHGEWKARLVKAIQVGELGISLDTLRRDDQCAFGKWLYGDSLSAADKASVDYESVKKLHAAFHVAAGAVGESALSGHGNEATQLLAFGGAYTQASANLVLALVRWKGHAH
jgi:hypothetical protein